MDPTSQEANCEQLFKTALGNYISNYSGEIKETPAKKLLFLKLSNKRKKLNPTDNDGFKDISITTSYDDSNQITEGILAFTRSDGQRVTLSAGLVTPPAIVVDLAGEPEDGEGIVIKNVDEPYFQDMMKILG